MIRQVLLDWSGTLCDDRELTLAATNETLAYFGAEAVDEATYQREFVLPIEHFYQPRIGAVDREQIDEIFFQRYRALALQSDLFPQVKLLIELLSWRGLRLGIVSTMAADILHQLLDKYQLRDHFSLVCGDAADKAPVLRQLAVESAQQHGIAADETLYVGDMEHDIHAGRSAGLITGAALYGYSAPTLLREAGADLLFDSVDAMIAQLDRDHLLATEQRVIATVGGILVSERGNLLLVKTRKWSNKFGLPGGKIDYGETMEEAFRREIHEETGLGVTEVEWLTAQDAINHPQFREPRHFILINYIARVAGEPEPHGNYESQQIGWYSLDEALSLELNDPTRSALQLAVDHPWLQQAAEL